MTVFLACLAFGAAVLALVFYGLMARAVMEAEDAITLARAASQDRDRWKCEAAHASRIARLNYGLARFWRDLALTRPRRVTPSPATPAELEELTGPETWPDGPESYGV